MTPSPLRVDPDTTVVICAYTDERWDETCEAIASACAQSPAPAEVLLVIDHNPALQARFEARVRDSPWCVRVLENTSAKGLSGARNTGVAAAATPYVAFLDDDAAAASGWLSALTAPLADPSISGAGGRAIPRWPGDAAPAWFPDEFNWVVGCSYRGLPETSAEIRNPIGASMILRRDDVLDAGGFHTGLGRINRIPLGCEETELCIRITRLTSGRFVYAPESVVVHRASADRKSARYFFRRCYAEGLSKAAVTSLAGSDDGLSSERDYVRRVLPGGVVRRLAAATALGRRSAAPRRSELAGQVSMIVLGAGVTACGYLRGRMSHVNVPERETPDVSAKQ
ncbi:MAG: glycosyltransferase [Gordonia sp. (in: high G+C Gram-positive bacteria)]